MKWQALRQRNFLLLFVASFISEIGSKVHRIALLVLVYNLTSDALWVSLTLAVQLGASVILSPLLAAWADTQEPRRLLAATDLLRAVLVLLIPVLGIQSLAVLLTLVFLIEVLRTLHDPVANAIIPLVSSPDQLDAANGLMMFTQRFAEVAFVGLAGVVVAVTGPAIAFWVDAVSYLLSALVVLRLPRFNTSQANRSPYWARVRDGVGFLFQQPVIRRTVGTLFIAALFGSVETVLMVVLAVSVMQVGAGGFGVIEAGMALGAVLGTLWVPRLTAKIDRERLFLYGLICYGLFELSIGAFPVFGWVVLAYLLSGVANMTFIVPLRSIMQLNTPPDMRTRAFAALGAVMNTAVLLGTMLNGALEQSVGAPRLFVIAGTVVTLIPAWLLLKSRLARPAIAAPLPAPVELSRTV